MVNSRWPVYIALILLVAITIAFAIMFVAASGDIEQPSAAPETDIYIEHVNELLANGDPERGATLVTTLSCVVCHVTGADVGIAPPFDGLTEHAADRRPPLSAASYIYESIIDPTAFVVEGYAGAMPENFKTLSDKDLGDILAYLLE